MSPELSPAEERAAIDRALAGDKAALKQVIERIHRVVNTESARALVRLRAQGGASYSLGTEDLRQEILAVLFADRARLLDAFDPRRGHLAGYVRPIARTRISNYLARRGAAGTHERATEQDDAVGSGAASESRRVMVWLLEALRADLSTTLWQTFVEVFVNEHTPKEAAAMLATSTGAVHVRVWQVRRRAKLLLRQGLQLHALPAGLAPGELSAWLSGVAQQAEESGS